MNSWLVAARFMAAALVVASGVVAAQPEPPASVGNGVKPAAASAGNGAARAADAPYEDRLIQGGALAPDESGDGSGPYNADGWPRFMRIEGVTSYYDQQGLITRENGVRLQARLDTPQHGALSIDATARVAPGSFIATIVQRDLAFDNNWRANNSLGVVTTLGLDLSRSQYRFYMPTFPAIGGTTEWIRDGDLQVQASIGQPGNFDGFRLSGFQSLQGSLATVGAQWRFAPQWQTGIQVLDTRDVESPYAVNGNGKINSDAVFGALAWNGGTTRLQANVVASNASTLGTTVRANGIWLDGRTVWDRATHNYGVFRLEPGLTWGYQPINNDIEGAYYRIAYQSLRWQVDGGIDQLNSVSGRSGNGTYLTINGSYRLNPRTTVGGNGSYLKSGPQSAYTASAFGDLNWSQGSSRLQFSVLTNNNFQSNDAQQVELDHTWNMPAGTRLSTSLTATRDTLGSATIGNVELPGSTTRRVAFSVLGGGDITNNLTLDANLQYNIVSRGGTANGVYGNLNLNWRLSSQWTVVGTYYDNRDDTGKLFVLDPLIPVLDPIPALRSRAVLLTLRYEDRGGTATAPLGGRPGGPSGGITGTIFLDVNDNGQRDASEPGAANVTVLLNGRFSTRTDEVGRFEFPFVPAGKHTITVVPDNLPLPWTLGDAKYEVRVGARSTESLEIGARRLR